MDRKTHIPLTLSQRSWAFEHPTILKDSMLGQPWTNFKNATWFCSFETFDVCLADVKFYYKLCPLGSEERKFQKLFFCCFWQQTLTCRYWMESPPWGDSIQYLQVNVFLLLNNENYANVLFSVSHYLDPCDHKLGYYRWLRTTLNIRKPPFWPRSWLVCFNDQDLYFSVKMKRDMRWTYRHKWRLSGSW